MQVLAFSYTRISNKKIHMQTDDQVEKLPNNEIKKGKPSNHKNVLNGPLFLL